jgi:hypothetical protein
MKFEFIKETMPDGSCRWFTEKDGYYVDGSISRSEPAAREMFNKIISGITGIKEVIHSITI